jgi:hypothetical protein
LSWLIFSTHLHSFPLALHRAQTISKTRGSFRVWPEPAPGLQDIPAGLAIFHFSSFP